MKIMAETDYMDEVIKSRKKEIDQIETIMREINDIAKDMALETTKQGEGLKRLDANITVARDNAKEGLEQLE